MASENTDNTITVNIGNYYIVNGGSGMRCKCISIEETDGETYFLMKHNGGTPFKVVLQDILGRDVLPTVVQKYEVGSSVNALIPVANGRQETKCEVLSVEQFHNKFYYEVDWYSPAYGNEQRWVEQTYIVSSCEIEDTSAELKRRKERLLKEMALIDQALHQLDGTID